MITFEEHRKQSMMLRKQNEELRELLHSTRYELEHIKRVNQNAVINYENLTEEFQPKKMLTRELKNLLEKQEFVDCILVNNNERYPAHKCILAVRSEALKRLLEGGPMQGHTHRDSGRGKENKKDKDSSKHTSMHMGDPHSQLVTIEVNEIQQELMPFIINYIYTADTENRINDTNVKEVMKAADWLEMQDLRKCCLAFMETKITRNTVIPVLIEAYELDNERLKAKCMKYIQMENIDLVKSSQWIKFKTENPKLALDLYERYVQETGGSTARVNSETSDSSVVYANAHLYSHAKTSLEPFYGSHQHVHQKANKNNTTSSKLNVRSSIKANKA